MNLFLYLRPEGVHQLQKNIVKTIVKIKYSSYKSNNIIIT